MPPSPKRRSWARLLLRGVLALILTLGVLDLVALQLARGAWRRAEERVAAEGSSLDFYVLLPETPTPAENAHGYLEAAGQILKALDEPWRQDSNETLHQALRRRQREIRYSGKKNTAEDLAFFRRGVEHFRPVLDVIDAALPVERAHFDLDRQVPIIDVPIPDLLVRLRISDLLEARARLAVAEGRGDEAWRDVYAMFRLATWTSQEMPTGIHQLVATAFVHWATLEAMALLRTVVPVQGEMEDILAEARRWDPSATYDFYLESDRAVFVTSLLDERVHASWMASGSRESDLPQSRVAPWLLSPPLRPWLHWNVAAYSDAMTKLSADCRQPAYRREKVVGEPGRWDELYPVPRWAALARSILSETVEAYFDACNKRDQTLADVDLMEIAFRLEDHRRRSGSYPSSLDALEGIPSQDPFSGGPYVYRLTKGGAVVYSVGRNRSDDGGTPPPYTKYVENRKLGDVVWRLGE
jgi:hypothetical protein